MTFKVIVAQSLHWLRSHAGKVLLGSIALLIAFTAGPRLLLGPRVALEAVVRRDFVQTVVASGHVETPHRSSIGVQVTGTVRAVPVKEGQDVAAGTTLIELDSAELRAAAEQARLAVKQAQAKLRQLREVQAPVAAESLRQAEVNHGTAEDTVERYRSLMTRGFIGQAELDEAVRAERVAASQLAAARRELATAQPNGSDMAAAEAALQQAQAAAQAAQARLGYALVRAPVAGTLITRDVEAGDVVQPGKVLMELSPSGDTQLVVQIDEKNLRLLHLGQSALASADAYGQLRFPAQLRYINPGVDAQRGSVEVKLAVPSPPEYLMQDMTVSVDIEVARVPRAVLVPADALHELDGTHPWVLLYAGGRLQRKAVTLGLRSGGWCQVLDGLAPGDRVVPITTTTRQLVAGQRVRPESAPSPP
jgi:HlyD family secretion protein